MSIVKSCLLSVALLSWHAQCWAQDPFCLHFGEDTNTCNDWYGPPVESTTCFDTPCVGGVCFRPWESSPILAVYDTPFVVASEPTPEQGTRESMLVGFKCYNGHLCSGCWLDEQSQSSFCGLDPFDPDEMNWWVFYFEDVGPCPPIFTFIENLFDKVS